MLTKVANVAINLIVKCKYCWRWTKVTLNIKDFHFI